MIHTQFASQNHDDGYLVFNPRFYWANRLTNYASPYLITVTNTTANESTGKCIIISPSSHDSNC